MDSFREGFIMAAATLKLLVLVICLNTFLYLGVNYALEGQTVQEHKPFVQGDLFDLLLSDKDKLDSEMDTYTQAVNDGEDYTNTYALQPNEDLSAPPTKQTGSDVDPDSGGFSLLDGLEIIWAIIATLWTIAFIPFYLFSSGLFPLPVLLLIGFPLMVLDVVTLVILIRGGGAT